MGERVKHGRWRAAFDALLLYLFVAAGTAIGGIARAAVSIVALEIAGPSFPWGTLIVNVIGSFVIGFFAELTSPGGRLFLSARTRQFVMTGLCGGFTTFSVFSLETFRFAADGDYPRAAVNLGISLTAWLVAVWLGHVSATHFNRLGG
ncbi:MAG: fluoride efflux transporter CrcB [Rhizobiaceae bacterium]